MANIFEIIFKGTNQTDPAAAGVKKNLDGISQSAKGVGSAMDMAMGVLASTQLQRFSDAAGRFLKSMVSEASDAQDIMVQLETVIQSTGGAAGLSADEISDMADSFADLTRFEDDAVIAGQTVLLQFTKIGKETFPEATAAMLDLASRMKIDIPSAAKLVGKALEGEFSGLSRYGIVFDDVTKGIINNLFEVGKTAEAQQLIIDELNKRFGGAAEAAGKTFAGSMERLNNAWNDFKETVGTALIENEAFQKTIDSLIDLVNRAADAFGNLPEGVQVGLVALLGFGAILAKLAPALISLKILLGGAGIGGALAGIAGTISGAVTGAFAALGAVIMGITAPVWLLIAALSTLIFTIVTLGPQAAKTFMMIANIIAASLNRVIVELRRFWNNFISFIRQMATDVKTWFTTVGRGIVDGIWAGIQFGWEWLKTQISNSMTSLLDWVKAQLGIESPSKLFAEQVGLPIAQGIQAGFNQGLRLGTPAFSASLTPAYVPAFAGAASGRSIQVGTVRVYGELSREARHRMRQEADEIAYNAVKMTMGRGRR